MLGSQVLIDQTQGISEGILGFIPHAESMILLSARSTDQSGEETIPAVMVGLPIVAYPDRLRSEISFIVAASVSSTRVPSVRHVLAARAGDVACTRGDAVLWQVADLRVFEQLLRFELAKLTGEVALVNKVTTAVLPLPSSRQRRSPHRSCPQCTPRRQ